MQKPLYLEYVSFEFKRQDWRGVHEPQECGHVIVSLGGKDQLLYDAEGLLTTGFVLYHSMNTSRASTLSEHICKARHIL